MQHKRIWTIDSFFLFSTLKQNEKIESGTFTIICECVTHTVIKKKTSDECIKFTRHVPMYLHSTCSVNNPFCVVKCTQCIGYEMIE